MSTRTKTILFGSLAVLLATAGCSSAPNSVASATPEPGFHAKSLVDAALVNSLDDRGDTIVTNVGRGWYR